MEKHEIEFKIKRKKDAQNLRDIFVSNDFRKKEYTLFELNIRGIKKDEIVIHIHTSVNPDLIDSFYKEHDFINLEYIGYNVTPWNRWSYFYNFKYK